MINVSNEFQKIMNERTDFKENAEITFANGTVLNLTEKDFTVSNNHLADSSETNGIPLGGAICRNVQIELINDDDRFSEYDFFGARIRLYLTFELSDTVERIEYGTFTVLTPETYGSTVIVTALDDMYKADKDYNTALVFPTTLKNIFIDACAALMIPAKISSFTNDNFVVNEKPEGITYRQLFGFIAMIAGGNARIDRTGKMDIVTYDFQNMESIYNKILDGGSYAPWNNGVNIDGGSFAPWNNGDNADGGQFNDRRHFHVLGNWKELKVETDDVVITGVQTTYSSGNNTITAMYGTSGYILNIDNPLISGNEQNAVELIGNAMVGGRFRPFSGDLVANPTCEFMDTVLLLDRKGNIYISFITDVTFQFFGFTSLKNSAEPALRNSAKAYSNATKAIIEARKLVQREKTEREMAVEQLAKGLKESSGLYMTEEEQLDGSAVYYMHDKPTLAESMIVWKLTAMAFGISTDGGKTYPYGFTVDGQTITRLLYAEGINADYINSGTISTKRLDANSIAATLIESDQMKAAFATVEELETANASIDNLKANKANVSDIYGINATLNNLNANKASVESLNASNARILSLEADHVSVSSFNAVSASVAGKLDASRLSSEIASLNGVVAKSISCDNYSVNYGARRWGLRPMQATINGQQVVILGTTYTG